MKKIGIAILIFILSVTIMGCSKIDKLKGDNEVYIDEKSQLNVDILSQMNFIKDSGTKMFNGLSEYQIIESILIDDNKVPDLKAVALYYDEKNNNSCNLAFIIEFKDENTNDNIYATCPINFVANEINGINDYEIEDGSKLSYEGNGDVNIGIRKIETNEILDFTVIYSYDESISQINFEIISKERTN